MIMVTKMERIPVEKDDENGEIMVRDTYLSKGKETTDGKLALLTSQLPPYRPTPSYRFFPYDRNSTVT